MLEPFITLLILFLLVTAAAVITAVAIYNRKRRQPTQPKNLDGTQTMVIPEKHGAPKEPPPQVKEEEGPKVAEEEPQNSEEETYPTEQHEEHLPPKAETQPTAVERARSTKGQEVPPRAVEDAWATVPKTKETIPAETQPTINKEIKTSRARETKAIETGKAQTIEPEETERFQQQEEVKKRQQEPIKRGGKPRGPTQDHEKERTQGIQHRRSKPEIICWKKEWQWVPAVEVPEQLLEKPGLTVLQNGSSLLQEESEKDRWRLERVVGEVMVRWNEAEKVHEAKIDVGQENYLLFRLTGQNLNRGRRVKSPSSGSYLVIAPNNWKRDETLAGPPPVMPEPTSLEGYQAHFFDLEKGGDQEEIAFHLPNGPPWVIKAKAPRFDLVGNRIQDASEHMGPLFGEGPPQIRTLDVQAWQEVRAVVIGEEGKGQGRWRAEFQPDPNKREQDLPPEVAARKGGWYFLRFYDNDDDLIESIAFRFLSALRDVRLPPLLPLPTEDGHKPVCVELVHEADCVVQPVSNLAKIQVEHQNDKTVLTVPPDPACDESQWLIGPGRGPRVEVTINVERIWWAVGEEHNSPCEWKDQLVVLSREDFVATSNKALWLRLPRHRWVDKVSVGFERSRVRDYDVRVTETSIAIPLRDFGDYDEVGDHVQEHTLKLWIKRDYHDLEGVLAKIPASHLVSLPPTKSWVGLGRKKVAIAKAVIQSGSGGIKINGRPLDDYFRQTPRKAKRFLERLLDLGEVREALSQMEVNITVEGSSPTTMRQPKAVAHALARALMDYSPRLTHLLRQAGFGGVKVKTSKAHRRVKP